MVHRHEGKYCEHCAKTQKERSFLSFFFLPWCCIIPVTISWLGAGTAFLATLLQPITPFLFSGSVLLIGYSHFRTWTKEHRSKQQVTWLVISTIIAAALWSWSIFVMGVFG